MFCYIKQSEQLNFERKFSNLFVLIKGQLIYKIMFNYINLSPIFRGKMGFRKL